MLKKLFTVRSIRGRFLILTTLLILILFGGLGVFIAYQNTSEIRKALDSKAGSVADLASLSGAEHLANFNFMGLDNLVQDILKDPEVSFAGFYNEKKELVTKSPVPASTSSLKVVERVLKSADGTANLGNLKIGYRTDSISRTLRKSVLLVAVGTLLTIILFSAGISLAAERIILQPIGRLSRIIEHVAGGDLSGRLETISNDELGDLAVALNTMIGNLNHMVSQVNGAADELNG
ncbi:MAG TPA: HAMP domain-containing protein, partial [Geobacteraceae bacterium]|nr:HAMP domain-containing protein [Geobacteraceae bacterium]